MQNVDCDTVLEFPVREKDELSTSVRGRVWIEDMVSMAAEAQE
jgi:hypothetical protein